MVKKKTVKCWKVLRHTREEDKATIRTVNYSYSQKNYSAALSRSTPFL